VNSGHHRSRLWNWARLERLRKKTERRANIPKNIPQGLKPILYYQHLAARLKSCPVTKRALAGVFPQPLKSRSVAKRALAGVFPQRLRSRSVAKRAQAGVFPQPLWPLRERATWSFNSSWAKAQVLFSVLRHGEKTLPNPFGIFAGISDTPTGLWVDFVGPSQGCASLALGYSLSAPPGRMPLGGFHALGWAEGPWRHD